MPMARARMPLAIGRGMDRSLGLVARTGNQPVDVRNVYARDAKMALRPGMALTEFPLPEWGTHILEMRAITATLEVVFVLYDSVTRQLRVYRLDTVGGTFDALTDPMDGVWGTLAPGVEFPVIVSDEANGRAFFAHAELDIDSRLQTIYYTPNFADITMPGTLTFLEADLNGDDVDEPVYFSWVRAHLEYMVGGGFGNSDDPDRGDIARISLPADPATFEAENYAIFGAQKDPILGAVPVAGALSAVGGETSVLALGKADKMYRLVGSSFDDFAPEILDPEHGFISAKCMFNTGKDALCWSNDGPRVIRPTGTEPIGQPLELISPLPSDFPSLGSERFCVGVWDKQRYLAEWIFPNVETASVPVPGFLLSLWEPKNPRWTFTERQQPVVCAGLLIGRDLGTPPSPPDGYVSDILAVDA